MIQQQFQKIGTHLERRFDHRILQERAIKDE